MATTDSAIIEFVLIKWCGVYSKERIIKDCFGMCTTLWLVLIKQLSFKSAVIRSNRSSCHKNNYNAQFIRWNIFRPTEADATKRNPTPVTTVTIPYIKGTSETISRILQPYNIRVTHKPTTTLRHLLTNMKDRDEPNNRQGAVYKIKCSDCQASHIGETGRKLNPRLTEHKQATRNGDANNHIAVHHQLTNHNIDWDSAQCLTYSTNYFQQLILESWYTNLEQTPLNRCQQLPASYKQLIYDGSKTDKWTSNKPT